MEFGKDKCQHFSIRGYVSEMRKKDINACRPFAKQDSKGSGEEKDPELPPLDVPDFPRWSCQNCLRRIGVLDDPPRTEVLNRCCSARLPTCHSPQCAASSSRGHVPVQVSSSPEPSRENISGGNNNASGVPMNVNGDERQNISLGNDMEKKEAAAADPTSKEVNVASKDTLEENQGFTGQESVNMDEQNVKEVSACGTGAINEDKNGDPNEDENSGGSSSRRSTKKVRMMVDILNSGASAASSISCTPSKDANTDRPKDTRKVFLGIDLNQALESPEGIQGNDNKVGKKRKRKILRDEGEKSVPNYDDMHNLGGNKPTALQVADGKSAFLPWQESRRRVPGEEGNGTSEPATSHADIAEFMSELQQRRSLSYAEEAVRNGSNCHVTQATSTYSSVQHSSQLGLSLTPPNSNPLGPNYPQTFVGQSSGMNSLSKSLELFSLQSLIQRESESEYHPRTAGQLNLSANKFIPATELLRLMNAGGHTSSSANAVKRQKFSEHPLPPSDHRFPKFPGKEFLQSKSCGASMRPPTSGLFDRFPGVQFGHAPLSSAAFGRDLSSSDRLMSDAFMSQAKENVRKVMLSQPKPSRAKEQASIKTNSGQIGQGSMPASAPIPLATQVQVRDSSTRVNLDLNLPGGPEMCTLNRNPADFCLPEPRSGYMIDYKDFRPRRTGSSGQKRKRTMKPATAQNQAKN